MGEQREATALHLPSPGSSGKGWVHNGVPPPPGHGTGMELHGNSHFQKRGGWEEEFS